MSSNPCISVEGSRFLTYDLAQRIRAEHQTPVYVYDAKTIKSQAEKALNFPAPYGLTVRFAMKACPNASILNLMHGLGLHFDVSSGFEATRAMLAGIPANHLSLSSQELPSNLSNLIKSGVLFNACSLHQLDAFGSIFPGAECGIRFNPGKGSGGTGKTNVGGPASSFGIWHELKEEVKAIISKHSLKVIRIHTHIGSGSDPTVWEAVSAMSLSLVEEFPDVTIINLGGGFKVGRMSYELANSTDLQKVGIPIRAALENFEQRTGRRLKLEIEPGTFLMANSGALLTSVQDMVNTGSAGHTFLKLDAGMTEVLRPSLYGAQHPIVGFASDKHSTENIETMEYIIVGHCCESGDLFSCAPGDGDTLKARFLPRMRIGDLVSIEGAGAYCSSMSTKNYNSFPEAPEVLLDEDNNVHLIRRRQTMDQILSNEILWKGSS